MRHFRLITYILSFLLLSSCNCLKNCPYQGVKTRDSVVVTEVVTYKDSTIYYHIKDSVVINITKDTTSHLETDMAISDVVVSNGELSHTLRNKVSLQPISISIPSKVTTTERERIVTQTVEVPVELSWWQRTLIYMGYLLMILIFIGCIALAIELLIKR